MTATPTPLRELARDIHYALAEDGALVRLSGSDYNKVREIILRVLTPERIAALSARQEEGAVDAVMDRLFGKGGAAYAFDPMEPVISFTAIRDALEAAIATPPASGEAGAVGGPDAAWQQASSEVFSTPLSQVREKYGTGDLYKAIASRADELRAIVTPPAASGEAGDWYVSDKGSVCIDFDADPKRQLSLLCKRDGTVMFAAYIDGDRVTGNAMEPGFFDVLRRLAAVAPAGMEPTDETVERVRHAVGCYDGVDIDRTQVRSVLRQAAMLAAPDTQGAG